MDTIGQQGGLEERRPVSPALNDARRDRITSDGDQGFEILNEKEVCWIEKVALNYIEVIHKQFYFCKGSNVDGVQGSS